jgi:Flp pilus assembly protein TadB
LTVVDDLAIVGCGVLFVAGIAVLGLAAWVWMRATAEAVRVRSHRNQADAEESTMIEATDAIEAAERVVASRRRPPPSAEEIAQAQRYESAVASNGAGAHIEDYPTTSGNAGFDEPDSPFGGGMYRG